MAHMAVAQAALDSRFRAVAIIWRCAGQAFPGSHSRGDDSTAAGRGWILQNSLTASHITAIIAKTEIGEGRAQFMPKLAVVTPCFR